MGEIPLSLLTSAGAEGAEVVYSLKNNPTFADMILNNIGEAGQIKRKIYQRRLPENPNKDYYYILRETNSNEPVLIEYGFIDNASDARKLKNNIQDYGEGVVKAIAMYLGYPYETEQQEDTYIVKRGDTLYSIGRRYNISVDELKRINNLIDNNLSEGQMLKLKDNNNQDNPIYIVQKGDTLYSIAKNNNVSVEEIININNLTNSNLSIGQELYIPKSSDASDEIETEIYTVQQGDSLWAISRKYNIPVPELIAMNNLKDLTLSINQKLLVPKRESNSLTYTVQQGDSLWSIARKNNLTVDELKEMNNLDSNLLSVGQQLIIQK